MAISLLAAGAIVAFTTFPALAERPRAAKLFPDRTLACVIVPDATEFANRYKNTSMGRMLRDPQMQPLLNHLYGSAAEAVSKVQEQIGVSLADLLAIPQGELALAVVPQEGSKPPAVAVLLDARDQIEKVRTAMQKGTATIEKAGGKRSEEDVQGTKVVSINDAGEKGRTLVYFDRDNTVVVSTTLDLAKQILAAWNGEKVSTLADNSRYASLERSCRVVKGEEPHVIAFVDPIGLIRAGGQGHPSAQMALAILPTLGLDGLAAAGFAWTLDAGQFDAVSQLHVLLDNPRGGALDVLALEPCPTKPEPWVPADVGSYLTLRDRVDKSYAQIAKLVDSLQGEGFLAKNIERRFSEPWGIDILKELLPNLEGRITHFTWLETPVTPTSQASVWAAKLKDAEVIKKALERVQAKNEKMVVKKSFGGKEYYQIEIPSRMPPPSAPASPGGATPSNPPPMPKPCFGVLDGYVIFADRPSIYEKAIASIEKPDDALANALDYKLVMSRIARRSGSAKPVLVAFSRPEQGLRLLYELANSSEQRGRMLGPNNPTAKMLDATLNANPLPPFSVIERYFAPTGAMLLDDETGLHYISFELRRTN
jgi:hypothetical protein